MTYLDNWAPVHCQFCNGILRWRPTGYIPPRGGPPKPPPSEGHKPDCPRDSSPCPATSQIG